MAQLCGWENMGVKFEKGPWPMSEERSSKHRKTYDQLWSHKYIYINNIYKYIYIYMIQYHELIHELTMGVSASSLSSFPPLSPPLQGTKNAMKANISETSRKRTRKTTSPLLGSLKWSLQPTTPGWGDGKGWRWELSRSLRWSHLHWTKACVQIQQNTCLYIDNDVTIHVLGCKPL